VLKLIVQCRIVKPDVGDLVLASNIGKGEVSGSDLRLSKDDLLFAEASSAFGIEVVDGQGHGAWNMRSKVNEQRGEQEDRDRGESAKGQ
jgi:hypothetical protein